MEFTRDVSTEDILGEDWVGEYCEDESEDDADEDDEHAERGEFVDWEVGLSGLFGGCDAEFGDFKSIADDEHVGHKGIYDLSDLDKLDLPEERINPSEILDEKIRICSCEKLRDEGYTNGHHTKG